MAKRADNVDDVVANDIDVLDVVDVFSVEAVCWAAAFEMIVEVEGLDEASFELISVVEGKFCRADNATGSLDEECSPFKKALVESDDDADPVDETLDDGDADLIDAFDDDDEVVDKRRRFDEDAIELPADLLEVDELVVEA